MICDHHFGSRTKDFTRFLSQSSAFILTLTKITKYMKAIHEESTQTLHSLFYFMEDSSSCVIALLVQCLPNIYIKLSGDRFVLSGKQQKTKINKSKQKQRNDAGAATSLLYTADSAMHFQLNTHTQQISYKHRVVKTNKQKKI